MGGNNIAKNEEEVKNSVFGFGDSNEAFAKFLRELVILSH